MRPQVGHVIKNKYRLVRLLGDGGMGSVFQAEHERLGLTVALKFLHQELSTRAGLVERFLQEARASAKIQSPYVVRVSDVDTTEDGAAFIVLEYLEGQTLQALYEDYHRTGQRLTYAEALAFALQMVEGLEAAHGAGVVHRDLKPDNVMIATNPKGERSVKLLDFGIAKLKVENDAHPGLTRPGVIMGTPEYMAPEQAYSADGVDSRADVFSLGVILFEMLAGRRPVGGEEPREIASAYLSGETADLKELVPTISSDLAAAVHKAMSPLAKDRFPTAKAFREALEPFAPEGPPRRPSHPAPPPPSSPDIPTNRRGGPPVMPPLVMSKPGISAAPAAGSGGVAKTWPGDDDPPPPPQAPPAPAAARRSAPPKGTERRRWLRGSEEAA